jgi:hypothetical protein
MDNERMRALAHMEQDSLALGCGEWCANLYDSSGNVVLCACGAPAGCAVMGKHSMLAWCEKCSPVEKHEAKMVYKPPLEIDNYIKDNWIINLEETKENIGTTD